ncbi:MAG: sulfatase [Opitutae bacterium]|nr:sulfatase [Opitutae bacterium]
MEPLQQSVCRRSFLGQTAAGLGSLAFGSMLQAEQSSTQALLPTTAKAKRIIFLYMAGGPSHLESFDYKPVLAERNGQPMPDSFTKGQPIAQLQGKKLTCRGPYFKFNRHGQSGQQMSEVFQHIPKIADDICIIRSMYTEAINHDPAHTFMNSGTTISGRPAMGSWFLYGLGSETRNLPGFVVLTSTGGGQNQPISARQWHSGFLPGRFQGSPFHSTGDPVLYVKNPAGVSRQSQGNVIDASQALNQIRAGQVKDPAINTRLRQYELAFRMQTSVPDLMDVSTEPKHILDLYGTKGADGSFAGNCLLARRLAERGVRFIQLYHRGWDHHGGIENGMRATTKLVDQGSAALIQDLKQRGMLDDTLVVWAGEFGRTPMAQGSGRDHHIKAFSLWMAGGGIKGGLTYGETDDFGYNAAVDRVSVHDLHATMLHLTGLDHEKLTFRYRGRDFRLTDVKGRVIRKTLA